MEKYEVSRKCTDCGFGIKAPLTKREAAFELFDTEELFGSGCVVCGSKKNTVGFPMLTLDKELITEWSQNEGLYVEQQDEELILGTGQYLDLIIGALDSPQTLSDKRIVLLYALCIIVYDNTVKDGSDWKADEKLKQRAIDELNKRKNLLILAGDWIMDYVQKVVYPQLDINLHNHN